MTVAVAAVTSLILVYCFSSCDKCVTAESLSDIEWKDLGSPTHSEVKLTG